MDGEPQLLAHDNIHLADDEPHLLTRDSIHLADTRDNSSLIHNVYESNSLCIVCRRAFQPETGINEAFDAIGMCRDCKTLVFDDLGTNVRTRDVDRRAQRRGRERRESAESIEDLFVQEFSQLLNLARQNRGTQLDGGAILSTPQNGISTSRNRTTRWRRAFSDNESDGLDHMDSLFGESDSNFSFSGYGGESDASVDGHSLLDREMFIQFDDESHVNTDTDIDPMHAGLDPWNSDDQDEDDGEWEEVDVEEEASGQIDQDGGIQGVNDSPVVNRAQVRWRTQEDSFLHYPNLFSDRDEIGIPPYMRRSGDYLDGRGLEDLLEHLAEMGTSRRGAPPAAASFLDNLPCVNVSKALEKNGILICAICKDPLLVGTEASQLPCLHFYHPSCIRPWLASRNSCPVCRYELPTDDPDYEEGKRNLGSQMEFPEPRQQEHEEESFSGTLTDSEVDETHERNHGTLEHSDAGAVNSGQNSSNREGNGAGWLFLVAAPIVSIVGVVLVLWLGKPLVEGRRHCSLGRGDNQLPQRSSPFNSASVSSNGRNRRWWPFF
uniref:E3 ubiquitin-protein ligase RING1 n=1 Tax=Anthurium amnicola TaxID=1678845 RepID=A0A1D1ZE03_9ARAE